MINVEKVRNDFPQMSQKVHGQDLVYFDNAASTLKPKVVVDTLLNHYSLEASNIHRGVHFLSESGTLLFEKTRQTVKEFINAKNTSEIIFTKGTTESLNLVASCFGEKFFTAGDVILLSTLEHHSNIVPWQIIAEKTGATVKEIPINDAGEILQDKYLELLQTNNVKMVSVNHTSNSLGTNNPIKEMIQLAHENGAKFTVDAAQSIAHQKVDVQDLDCDFLAFSSHKIYGPTGVGVLYGKTDLLNEMPPYQGGGDMIDVVTFEKTTYNDLPHKFEAGTPHIAGVIALKSAIDYVVKLGFDYIYNHEKKLLDYATKEVSKIDGVKLIGTAKDKASVLSFIIEGAHPNDIGTLLDRQGIAIRTGHHCTQPLMKRMGVTGTCRASFSIYNTIEEVHLFINALKKAKDFL